MVSGTPFLLCEVQVIVRVLNRHRTIAAWAEDELTPQSTPFVKIGRSASLDYRVLAVSPTRHLSRHVSPLIFPQIAAIRINARS
jgi:hypothetical protein